MDRLVALAVSRRYLMVGMFVAVLVGGLIAFRQLNIEAYPDPTPPMVDIVTQSPGLSSEEIERYITIPIETQVAGIKNLRTIRTISLYGLSDVKLQFSFDYTYEEALQQVLNRLSQLAPLPGNAQPTISPLSPIGEIFRYRLKGPPNYSVLDLKTLQDWVLQRRFRAVPGVVDVTGWGGKTKTYELQVDFNKLVANGLTLPQVLQAVTNANINVGGNTVNIGAQSAVVRGVGLIRSIDDLNNTMVSQSGGNPVLVKDIAHVTIGEKPRLGIAGLDQDDDIVQGIVLMRRGEQSSPTIARVEKLVHDINNSSILPPGVKIERIYDRKDLIDITTHTVLHNMVVGIILIVLLQWMFLGDLRSALIVGATIPFALFFAVIILVLRGESANLLSVGAIDFGLIVDATVIMVEAIFRRLSQTTALSAAERSHISFDTTMGMKSHAILSASADVSRSIFFAAAIIIAAFLPLFTLSGVEGNIFGPMARTYAYALAGGLLATFTVTPALSAIILPSHMHETETWVVKKPRPALCAGAEMGGREPQDRDGRRRRSRGADHRVRAAARAGIPAQAGRGQSVDPRHAAADHLAAGGQRLRQRDAEADPQPARGGIGGVAARPPRRRHRRRRPVQRRILRAPEAQQRMARHPRQGRTDRAIAGAAAGQIPGRRIQLLAISAGQRLGGGLGRQGRELDQALRQRSAGADRHRQQDQIRAEHRAGRHRSCGVHLARPADHPDRYRPRPCRALRPVAGRYQRHHQGRGRRRQRRRSL